MKTNRSVRRRLPCFFFTVSIFAALAFSVVRAQDPEKMALNKPEKIIGNWQSVGAGDTVTAKFTAKSEFDIGGTENGKKVVQMKGTYTVDAASWPLKVTFVSGEKKSYGAIAVLSSDRIMMEKLGSLEEKPALDEDSALTMTRQPEALAANSETSATSNAGKLIGKWKSIGDPIALEGASLTMSFSEKGAFQMTMTEKSGEKHTQEGSYTMDAASSPMKVTVTSGEKTGYYAIAVLPNDQIKTEEMKSSDETARLTEEAVTLAREPK